MISSHVLDLALGAPARGLTLHLDVSEPGGRWRRLATTRTDDDGRAALADAATLAGATCRLSYETGAYGEAAGRPTFFPVVEVVFEVPPEGGRLHVPVLLSPFGYTVYRGS